MEVDRPPLRRTETSGESMSVSNEAIVTIPETSGESMSVSNEAIVTIPSSSEVTPSILVEELVESNVHVLEITSQLMVST